MTEPLVRLRGVGKEFAGVNPVRVLHSVDLDIAAGDMLAVVGRSGSGKSTLLNLLGLLDVPSEGELWFEGAACASMGERQLAGVRAGRIGFVFQAFHLLETRTVVENIEMGLMYRRGGASRRRTRAVEIAERVGLAHRLSAFPATLSGGERQRVAVARAAVGEPALVLCDEPTGNLDSVNAAAVMDVLVDMNRSGLTVVVVSHDPEVAARARSMVHVVDGQVSSTTMIAAGHVDG